jgi:hypothetical protein
MQRVRPGAPVQTKDQAPPKPPQSPLERLFAPERRAATPPKPGKAG